ncbi:MAG: glycosyltransferase [Verrucomicrobiales bacterium]
MRIAHYYEGRCNPAGAGGVDLTVCGLCKEQGAAGHEVGLFCASPKEEFPVPGATVRNFAPGSSRFATPPNLITALEEFSPQVMHFHSNYIPRAQALARWARKQGIPYVVTPNGNCSTRLLSDPWWIKRPYRRLFELPYLNRAAFVHSVGDRAEIERYGVRVPIVDTLNGFDTGTIPDGLDPGIIERKLPAWAGRKILLYLGRLDLEQKGLDRLLEGMAQVPASGGGLGLVLVGTDWKGSKAKLEQLVDSLDLGDSVHFWGPAYDKEKFDLLHAADCFVHTSRWEGMSFAVAEALATNGLCLLTPPADPGGLVAKLDAGILSDESPEGIADAIGRFVAAEPAELERIRSKAREIVETHMGWQEISATVTGAYRTVAGVSD